jgi:hypothetical protein
MKYQCSASAPGYSYDHAFKSWVVRRFKHLHLRQVQSPDASRVCWRGPANDRDRACALRRRVSPVVCVGRAVGS